MAITVPQAIAFGNAYSGSFASNVTAGNTIFLVVTGNNTAGSPVAASPTFNGSAVTGATQLIAGHDANTGNVDFVSIWMLPNVSGGAKPVAITVTGATSNAYCGLAAYEVAGLGASPAMDKSAGASGNSSTPGSGTTAAITASPEFILGAVAYNAGITAGPAGWTNLQIGASGAAGWASYQIATSSGGSYDYNGMSTQGSSAWYSAVVTVAAGGGGTTSGTATLYGTSAVSANATYSTSATSTLSGTGTLSASVAKYIAGIAGSGLNSYFVDQHGVPRFHLLEEPWTIHSSGGRYGGTWQTDFDGYLTARAAQGYTAIIVAAFGTNHIDAAFNDGRTWDGVPPFLGGNNVWTGADPSQLNNTFWARFDYFFSKALTLGLSIFLELGMSYNWSDGTAGNPSVFYGLTLAQATAFGTAIATRYPQSQYPNLFWFRNDDSDGSQDQFHVAMTQGIQAAGDTRTQGSCEYMPETDSHIRFDTGAIWVPGGWGMTYATWNWVYTYDPAYLGVEKAYTESGTTPIMVVAGDGTYYGDTDNSTPDYTIRRFMWWALASGARGINATDGPSNNTNAVWNWGSTALSTVTVSDPIGPFCRSVIGGIVSYFSSLTDWWKLIPDTGNVLIIAGRGTKATSSAPGFLTPNFGNTDNYVAGSVTPTGTLAVIYCGQHFSITIDQTKMAAGYTATWVDPNTAATTSTTAGSTYNSTPLGNNSAGNPDWVLVLQAPLTTTIHGTATLTGSGSLTPNQVKDLALPF